MKSVFVLLSKAKGDNRDNSDSKQKLALSKIWKAKAGSDSFGYFMVFDSNPLKGSLSFDASWRESKNFEEKTSNKHKED